MLEKGIARGGGVLQADPLQNAGKGIEEADRKRRAKNFLVLQEMELFPCEKKKGQRANEGAERGERRRGIIVIKMAVDHGIASPGDHHDKEHDIILSVRFGFHFAFSPFRLDFFKILKKIIARFLTFVK